MGRFIGVVIGLVLLGIVIVWLVKAVIGLLVFAAIAAVVIGGGIFLYGKAKRALSGDSRRMLR